MILQVHLTAALGTFDVAATVDMVSIKGEGEKQMMLSSPFLSALNRQLQFITYTNTMFNPKTADTGKHRIRISCLFKYGERSIVSYNLLLFGSIMTIEFQRTKKPPPKSVVLFWHELPAPLIFGFRNLLDAWKFLLHGNVNIIKYALHTW